MSLPLVSRVLVHVSAFGWQVTLEADKDEKVSAASVAVVNDNRTSPITVPVFSENRVAVTSLS